MLAAASQPQQRLFRGEFVFGQDSGVTQLLEHAQLCRPARRADHDHAADPQFHRRRALLQQHEDKAEDQRADQENSP
jgi:hypothetical protein